MSTAEKQANGAIPTIGPDQDEVTVLFRQAIVNNPDVFQLLARSA
jgi:hypothetical protein